jgi:hypothetical protein
MDKGLINVVIRQELANRDPLPGVEIAIKKSEVVESKLREALDELTVVNRALEGEVRERDMVDHQLAATIEQEEGARYAAFHDVLTGLPVPSAAIRMECIAIASVPTEDNYKPYDGRLTYCSAFVAEHLHWKSR